MGDLLQGADDLPPGVLQGTTTHVPETRRGTGAADKTGGFREGGTVERVTSRRPEGAEMVTKDLSNDRGGYPGRE